MLYVILGLVALFFAVVLFRAATFNPKPQPPISDESVTFDKDAAVATLAELAKSKLA